jgi:predicted outer membrane lipoprotein
MAPPPMSHNRPGPIHRPMNPGPMRPSWLVHGDGPRQNRRSGSGSTLGRVVRFVVGLILAIAAFGLIANVWTEISTKIDETRSEVDSQAP